MKKILEGAKKLFKEVYNIPDGVNPETGKTYLLEALEKYPGLQPNEYERYGKFLKSNIVVWKYYGDDTLEKNNETIINPEWATMNVLELENRDGIWETMFIVDIKEFLKDISKCVRRIKFKSPMSIPKIESSYEYVYAEYDDSDDSEDSDSDSDSEIDEYLNAWDGW